MRRSLAEFAPKLFNNYYASWGLDFIKADDMFGSGPGGDHSGEIAALGAAIRKSGRPIVLSLSPGTHDAAKADFIAQHAQIRPLAAYVWWQFARQRRIHFVAAYQ